MLITSNDRFRDSSLRPTYHVHSILVNEFVSSRRYAVSVRETSSPIVPFPVYSRALDGFTRRSAIVGRKDVGRERRDRMFSEHSPGVCVRAVDLSRASFLSWHGVTVLFTYDMPHYRALRCGFGKFRRAYTREKRSRPGNGEREFS
ncbi:hypothetical protein PUN28_018057 [Cardiocondyla obscurior]|uniref:Uncharacterized protein n=1 Tax=Cardiocondyla obscurior TaxID=286306 RepID=A0AAW2EHV1_9HYME